MPEITPSRYTVMCGWDDVPHLSQQVKDDLKSSYPPHELKARTKGIPSLGAGAIYPVDEEDFKIKPFAIPSHWPRVFALDVGWNRTAAVWAAIDRETDCVYLYTEHYRGQAEPTVHAAAIKARGDWIPGVIDPASRGRSQVDGKQLFTTYRGLGLNIAAAENAVEAGILAVWERLSTGRLKVFSTCSNWLKEQRLYRRDESGKVVKKGDHLMDATRYLIVSGLRRATVRPVVRQMPGAPAPADPIAGV